MPPKKKRKVKQKTKVSAKTKEVLKELGETTNGQDAKTAAMSLLGGGSCSNAAPLFVPGSNMVCNACGTSV